MRESNDLVIDGLHCGACGRIFDFVEELKVHLSACRAARIMLPMANVAMFGGDTVGHPIGSLLVGIRQSIGLIHKYAMAISMQVDNIKRAQIHFELCQSLGLSKNDFRPFDDAKIISDNLTPRDAEKIIWDYLDEIKFCPKKS